MTDCTAGILLASALPCGFDQFRWFKNGCAAWVPLFLDGDVFSSWITRISVAFLPVFRRAVRGILPLQKQFLNVSEWQNVVPLGLSLQHSNFSHVS